MALTKKKLKNVGKDICASEVFVNKWKKQYVNSAIDRTAQIREVIKEGDNWALMPGLVRDNKMNW